MIVTQSKFRPHEHIRDPRDFRRAFDRRKPASDQLMIVYAAENGLDCCRLGISIGKKKVKRAVDRNRIKRLVREAFRLGKSEIPKGVDLVVVPRGPGMTFDGAMTSLPGLCRSAARRIGHVPPKAAP